MGPQKGDGSCRSSAGNTGFPVSCILRANHGRHIMRAAPATSPTRRAISGNARRHASRLAGFGRVTQTTPSKRPSTVIAANGLTPIKYPVVIAASRRNPVCWVSRQRRNACPASTVKKAAGRSVPPVDIDHDTTGVLTRKSAASNPIRKERRWRSEEHTSELQSRQYLVCRLLLEKKKK